MVEGDIDIVRLFEVLLTRIVHRQQTIILDILVHQTEDERLPYHSPPEAVVVIGPGPEPFALVVSVRLYHGGRPAYEDVHEIVHLELGTYRLERLQHHQRLFACLHLGPRIHAIVAASAVILSVLLAEVVQQRLAAAHGTFGIRHGLHQQQLAYLLLGYRLALHELFELLNILVAVKGDAAALAAVAARTPRLLVIPLQALGNIVMDDETDVGFVNTHAESYRRHDDIGLLHQEGILIPRPCGGIHSRMVRQGLDAVGDEQFSQLLDLLAAETVDDARLPFVLFDILDNFAGDVDFRTYLVKQIGTVE